VALVAASLSWLGLAVRTVLLFPAVPLRDPVRVLAAHTAHATVGVLAFCAGWVLADAVSGLVHFWADELADEHFPWLGRNVIAPFREHHTHPADMTKHGVVETNGDSALAVLPVLLSALWFAPTSPSLGGFGLFMGILGFSVAVLLTNQIHQWAHAQRRPRSVRWLQRCGLILSPGHHARHHRKHDRAYCITTGWCNPVLDRLLPRPPASPPRV